MANCLALTFEVNWNGINTIQLALLNGVVLLCVLYQFSETGGVISQGKSHKNCPFQLRSHLEHSSGISATSSLA